MSVYIKKKNKKGRAKEGQEDVVKARDQGNLDAREKRMDGWMDGWMDGSKKGKGT